MNLSPIDHVINELSPDSIETPLPNGLWNWDPYYKCLPLILCCFNITQLEYSINRLGENSFMDSINIVADGIPILDSMLNRHSLHSLEQQIERVVIDINPRI